MMNDKLYSKKTLRVAIRDLEEQNRILRVNRDSLERAVDAMERELDSAVRSASEQKSENASIKANASIVSPKVLHDFQEWCRRNPDEDVIPMIKTLRALTRDETGEMCGLREARDFVWFITGHDVSG